MAASPKQVLTPKDDQFRTYKAVTTRVVDGDTVELQIDLGFDLVFTAVFRLYGIDAPEITTSRGGEALKYLHRCLLPEFYEKVIYARTIKNRGNKAVKEKFGRFLAEIYENLDDLDAGFASSINQKLVNEGLAKPYFGHGKREK